MVKSHSCCVAVVERQGELKQRFQELKDENSRKEELCHALRAELVCGLLAQYLLGISYYAP